MARSARGRCIIAQGLEAGGHRGIFLSDDLTTQLGTFALLPQIVRAVKVPVSPLAASQMHKGSRLPWRLVQPGCKSERLICFVRKPP